MVWALSKTYRSVAKNNAHNTTFVAERFHLVQLINHQVLNVWKLHDGRLGMH